MPVVYNEFPNSRTIEIEVSGRVTQDDWDRVAPRFDAFMTRHDKIRLIEIIESLDGFDPALLWKGIRFDLKAFPHITHCAVVTDIGWMSPITRFAGAMVPIMLRVFPLKDVEAARRWLAEAGDDGEPPTAVA